MQWYFDNLLPEEGQRALLAKAPTANVEDAFALLQVYGAESAGSLNLLPPDTRPANGTEKPLPFEELSQRIQHMPQVPLAYRSAKKMSLAGAQHKMAVIWHPVRPGGLHSLDAHSETRSPRPGPGPLRHQRMVRDDPGQARRPGRARSDAPLCPGAGLSGGAL